MINFQETDISRELAKDAHRGTSQTPDIRAGQVIQGYMDEMQEVLTRFGQFATPENEGELKAALETYKMGYIKHLNARLSAQSRCLSTMIAGPSGFNHRKAERDNATEHRRTTELLEWREKALNRLNLNFNPVAIAYAVVTPKRAMLFCDQDKVTPQVRKGLKKWVDLLPYDEVGRVLKGLKGKKVWVDGSTVNSSELRDSSTVILFVRGNWCPFCSKQVEEITSHYKNITELGAKLIFITPKPLDTTRRVAEFFKVEFEFWLDESLSIANALGIAASESVPEGWTKEYGRDAFWPTALVIDKDGIIRYSKLSRLLFDRPNSEQLVKELRKL